jgi:hypothetical protein
MNNDRELLQQALDALQGNWRTDESDKAIEALRARLAQPENDFNPDWDAMAVMVEEQQRMAKRIEELEARLAQPEQEPVAWFCKLPDNKISIKIVGKPTEGNWQPLYTAPPQREWVGLTDEEVVVRANAEVFAEAFARGVAWAELKLKEKNT